jgi:CRP-like cAMP-binding protein
MGSRCAYSPAVPEVVPQPSADIAPGVLEALRRNSLFATLPAPALREAAARSRLMELRRGNRLWARGDPATSLAIVAHGRLKCWSAGVADRQWVSAIVRTGGTCDLAPCVEGGVHPSDADAMDRLRVVLVPTAALRAEMDRSADFTRRVASALAAEVRGGITTCEDVTLRTPLQRLARHLAAHFAVDDVFEIRETQSQLAAQLGTVREVVGRGLRELERRGAIARTGRTVRILSPKSLAAAAR